MGGSKKTPRKSIGDLDMASFLTSLGDDDDFEEDEKVDDVSFVTARNGTEDGDSDNDSDAKPSKPSKISSSSSAVKPQSAKKKEVSTSAATTKLSKLETPKTASKEKSIKKSNKQEMGGDDEDMDIVVPSESTKKTRQQQQKKPSKNLESEDDDEEVPSKAATSLKRSSKKAKMAIITEEDDEEESASDSADDSKLKSKLSKLASKKEQEKAKAKGKKSRQQEEEEEDEDDEEEAHRQELLKLKETDPEFFKHLEKEGKDLLAFGDDEDEDDEAEGEEEGDDEEDEEPHEEQKRDLSLPAVKKLEARAQGGDAVATRKLMTCFRNAVRSVLARPDRKRTRKQIEESFKRKDEEDIGDQEGWDEREALSVPPEVLDRLVSVSLTRIAAGLDQIIWPEKQKKESNSSQSKRAPLAKNSPHFAPQEKKIRQFLNALTAALNSKDASPSILQHLLLSSRLFATYYGSFEKEARKNLEALVRIWAKPETENASRIASFFRIRQLCALRKDSLLELTIKDMYVQFARQAASPKTQESRDRMAVQARSLGEMYGLDMGLSYRVGFQHIRQLALHVRAAMASKSQESLQSVCSWRFVHCLRLWALILATHAPRLDELVFPFVQVALGVISLVSAPRYVPLRLHCIEAIQVVVSSNPDPVYVPVGLPLTQMLSIPDLVQKKIVPATDPPPDLISMLRLKQDQMKKASTRLVLIPKVVETLRKHLESHRFSVAFPEIWLPVRLSLVKNVLYTKEGEENKHKNHVNKNKSNVGESDAWKMAGAKAIRALVQDADNWSDQVKKAREGRVAGIKRPGGPSDVDGCDKFQLALRANAELLEESKKKKKQKLASEEKEGDQAVSSSLFPSSVEQAVENILSEAAEVSTKSSSIVRKDDEEEAEGDEKVERLNPKDFL